MSVFTEEKPSARRDSIPLGRSASFKADDYVHPDHAVSFTEGKGHGEDDVPTTNDDEEFPPEEHQFTWRAAIVGSLLGCVVAASNLYVGLKIGWTFGASLWGAIFGFIILKPLARFMGSSFGPRENATCQAAATTAGGLSTGFVTAIPAMYRMGLMGVGRMPKDDILTLFLWTTSAAFFGMFFAVPLRTHFVINQDLVFPTPRAAAETIRNLHRSGSSAASDAKKTATIMMIAFMVAMIWVLIGNWIPGIFDTVHILYWIGNATGYTQMQNADALWGWAWSFDFSFFGAGMMTPASTVFSFMLGELIAYGIAGPLLVDSGYLEKAHGFTSPNNGTAQSWFLWPGIALMVFTAFGELGVNGKSLWHGVTSGVHECRNLIRRLTKRTELVNNSQYVSKDTVPAHEQVPTLWWVSGLLVSAVFTIVLMALDFKVPVYSTILAILLSFILAFVGLQAAGETDINPTGSIGKVTQLVFSRFPGELQVVQKTNLMCANISASICAQAVDMVGDLKTGHLLGASPRSQFLAQCVGSVFAIAAAVPLFILYTEAYHCIVDASITKCEFGLVSVRTWQAVCEVLTGGGTVPKGSVTTAIVFAVLAIANILIRIKLVPKSWHPYWLNLNAVGLGLINPNPALAMAMLTGWAGGRLWIHINKVAHEKYMYSVAGGFISGVGVAGIIKAILVLGGVAAGTVRWGCTDELC
ncbi:MAG: OPT oligopeptide transporter protein-domain-containing protein [Linnemannia gamsii]|nr:MAG: OPT oligopeptide transporter protein-domain-containing protein [Linnemannia gamsii]